ncbi:hypothetical protein NM688_g2317 [Phlebia brevispora]|uniref:Uncharacterized protein n=1 Tax=Phlebia brevispora TaxID=194682 RepID=A0ACC1T904_9APHY|nr:hypothetical protein NM688_g2317 [Phlebia brevispora]
MPYFVVSETSVQSLSMRDLEHVFNQSPFSRFMVRKEMVNRHHHMLSPYLSDTTAFMEKLREWGSVITGSFALSYILGKTNITGSDMDIYVPYSNFEQMKVYLKDVEGYSEDAMVTRQRAEIARALAEQQDDAVERVLQGTLDYVSVPLDTGIVKVATLNKGSYKIDIIQNQSASALYAITRFWSTLQMNYISASGYCCAYPQTTFLLEGVINPHVMNRNMTPYEFVHPLIQKYERRGYAFRYNWYEPETAGCRLDHDHPFCPTKRRSFEDGHSYYGTFGTEQELPSFNNTSGAVVSEWKVGWQLGGRHERTGYRLPAPARAWHSVTGQGEKRVLYTLDGFL